MIAYVQNKLKDLRRYLYRRSDGEKILLERYRRLHGKELDLSSPRTFSEKLFWRMISLNRKSDPRFARLSDKYEARAYVSRRIGGEYLTRLLWQGTDPRAIPFGNLPSEYIVKTNHGSGQVIVVQGKADQGEIMEKLEAWLASNYYWSAREYQYFPIKPRIIIEEYLAGQGGGGALDYRFWCFNGVPEVIQVDNHAHDINPFFDTQWNLLDLHYREGVSLAPVEKPGNLDQMLAIAARLSEGFDFVRIDLYNVDGKIYFGEFTFTPVGGWIKLRPERWDLMLGQKWMMSSEG
jgi:hypothetical protein